MATNTADIGVQTRIHTSVAGDASSSNIGVNIININELEEDSPSPSFELYDLRVTVICPPGAKIFCGAKPGDHFILQGEMLFLPPNQGISIYSLAGVLPLLAAKQRPGVHPHDWMATDAEVACPDPFCGTRLRIERIGLRKFRRSDVTAVPMPSAEGEAIQLDS